MDAEFSTQYRVMKALADGGAAVPLPRLGFYEDDPQYLGVPFFTMDHVEGKVPSDNIPYTMEGWVIEATPEQQARMWWSGLDALAAVHRTDWRALGLDWLGMAGRGKPGIEQQMSYYRDFLDWAAQGAARSRSSRRRGSGWSTTGRPKRARSCSAGATAASATSSGTTSAAAAVLDWEMASLGQPEMDLGWYLYFNRQFADPLGVPRPPGLRLTRRDDRALLRAAGAPDAATSSSTRSSRASASPSSCCGCPTCWSGATSCRMESDMGTNNIATQLLTTMLELDLPA